MRILVTGGTGFIGANFLNLSVPRMPDHEFLNLDLLTYAANPASLRAVESADNYRFERLDIADAEAVKRLFESFEPELVVHFAAESHVDRSIHGPADFIRTNIVGTFNLLEAARARAERGEILFHHVSTDEVYGSLGDSGAFVETTAFDPSSPYSSSKAAADHLVSAYHRTYGLATKITNCSNNYGPLQFPEKLIPLILLNASEGKPLPVYGEGLNVRDWLYVTDHCEAVWAVIEKGRVGETYNVGGNCEVRNIDIVKELCRVLASHSDKPVEEYLDLITFVKDRPGHDLRYAIDASKIRQECDWSPVETLDSGLEKTVRWYLENSDWVATIRSGEYREWIDRNYAQR
jgi:dTDP-glucose 4,6-dehydratase